MSPRYDTVPAEPQLTRPRASLAAQPAPEATVPASEDLAAKETKSPAPAADDLVTVTIAIPREVRTALKISVAQSGTTIQHAAAEAFRMWLAVQQGTKTT